MAAALSISELPEGVRILCLRKVYEAKAELERLSDQGNQMIEGNDTLATEPTVRWPKGVPSGKLFIEDETETVVANRAVDVNEENGPDRVGGRPFRPQDIGTMLHQWEHPERFPGFHHPRSNFTEFRTGTRREVRMRLVFEGEVGFRGNLDDVRWTSGFMPLAKLPAPIRAEISTAKAAAAKRKT